MCSGPFAMHAHFFKMATESVQRTNSSLVLRIILWLALLILAAFISAVWIKNGLK